MRLHRRRIRRGPKCASSIQPVGPPLVRLPLQTSTLPVPGSVKCRPRPVMLDGALGIGAGQHGKSIAGKDCIRGGQQDRKFVLIVFVLISAFVSIVQQMPPVLLLDEGQLFQRTCRIIPSEEKRK